MPKPSQKKEAFWRKTLRQQQKSGQSIRQFCQQQRLSEPSFYSWRRELARRDQHAAAKPKRDRSRPVSVTRNRQPSNASVFIPLQLAGGNGATIELVHPRGHVLRIPAGFDEQSLRKLFALLDQGSEA